jgi:hypothetical protein
MSDRDRIIRLERDVHWMQENLKLQAAEYERRLSTLNHAHEKAQQTARTYVTQDKYEDYVVNQASALEKALERVDDRFGVIGKELDEQRGAAAQAARAAEHFARNLGLGIAALGLLITLVVLFANHTI